jgi:hypothetical protein
MEISVSMVAAPWRRFVHAARWNGQPPYTRTGVARIADSHCQYRTCSGGTIAMATTGTARTRLTSSRVRRAVAPSAAGAAGRGTRAV